MHFKRLLLVEEEWDEQQVVALRKHRPPGGICGRSIAGLLQATHANNHGVIVPILQLQHQCSIQRVRIRSIFHCAANPAVVASVVEQQMQCSWTWVFAILRFFQLWTLRLFDFHLQHCKSKRLLSKKTRKRVLSGVQEFTLFGGSRERIISTKSTISHHFNHFGLHPGFSFCLFNGAIFVLSKNSKCSRAGSHTHD